MRRRLRCATVRETRPEVCDEIACRLRVDTRAHMAALLVGSAARGIARRLRDHGYRLAIEPQSFFVKGTPGPARRGRARTRVGVGQDTRERGDEPHGMIGACTTTRMVTR